MNQYNNPFIYIAAMPRSGSTMLAGMLSREPDSLVLSEPGFQRGLVKHIDQISDRVTGEMISMLNSNKGNSDVLVQVFCNEILPILCREIRVAGIKECFLENWDVYEKYLTDVRYVVLARNPLDIYLSIEDYANNVDWYKKMWIDKGTDYIASRLNRIWMQQREIIDAKDCLRVRYEDLCSGKVPFVTVTDFLGLDFSEPGATSQKFDFHEWRAWEVKKHGDSMTEKSVDRWKSEAGSERYAVARDFAGKMKDYCRYWRYEH